MAGLVVAPSRNRLVEARESDNQKFDCIRVAPAMSGIESREVAEQM